MSMDILEYALQGDPVDGGSPESPSAPSFLRDIFEERRINPLDNAEAKIQQLTSDFIADEELVLTDAELGLRDGDSIPNQIRNYTSLPELHRTVLRLSSTVQGCKFLAENGASVREGIFSCWKAWGTQESLELKDRKSTTGDIHAIIRILNNLVLNMRAKGVGIGDELCDVGLHYSAKAFQLESTKMYLELMMEQDYVANRHTRSAIASLAIGLSRPKAVRTLRDRFNLLVVDEREAVLSLLTGWEHGGIPATNEIRKPSFASILSRGDRYAYTGINLYVAYIIGLGQIGDSNALHQEYAAGNDTVPPALHEDQSATGRACLFAISFTLAGNVEAASLILQSAFSPGSTGRAADMLGRALSYSYSFYGHLVSHDLQQELDGLAPQNWQDALDHIRRHTKFERKYFATMGAVQQSADWIENPDGTGYVVEKTGA